MNGHSNINTSEATEHLKNILNVGKSESAEEEKSRSAVMETPEAEASFGVENAFQQITLSGSEENIPIYGRNVVISSSPLTRGVNNSSNIVIDNIVNYGWEQKYYFGCLVSVHLSKKYFAYALKAQSSPSGFVRVIRHNAKNHLLLRGFRGGAKDLSFAHSVSRVLLGCVDELGELFVFEVFDNEQDLTYELCVHIVRPVNTLPSMYHRIVWCPYVPEDGSGIEGSELAQEDITQDDMTQMMSSLLVVTHDEKAEIWNIDMLMKEYGRGEIPIERVKTGMQLISEHSEPITAAAFSPDAIALATSSLDGEVKFFQVNIHDNEGAPKCLHKWTPHFGKPLSSLFFLDNHKNPNSDTQFWKFAITGADNNQELKVWSCKTWSCLQTVRLLPCTNDVIGPCLKAEVDMSAGYLVLSDINRKVMYVLKIRQDDNAMISSIAEYFVKYPVLSFAISDIVPFRGKLTLNAKHSGGEGDEDDADDEDKDDDYDELDSLGRRQLCYLLKLYWIHTKSFQFCRIIYVPKTESPLQSAASVSSSQDSFVYKDGLSDLVADVPDQMNLGEHVDMIQQQQTELSLSPSQCIATNVPPSPPLPLASTSAQRSPSVYPECAEILLTPKDFASHHSDLPSVNIPNSYNLTGIEDSKDLNIDQELDQPDEITSLDADHNARPRRKSSQHSCASSPSREVAEILSPNQILSHDEKAAISPKEENDEMDRATDDLPVDVLNHSPCHSSPELAVVSQANQNDWPQPPDPNREYKVIPRSDGDMHKSHAPLEKSLSRHNIQRMADGDVSPDEVDATSKSALRRIELAIEALALQTTSMNEAIQRQGQAIQFVQNKIQGVQQQQKYIQHNIESIDSMDNVLLNKIEQVVAERSASEFSRLEDILRKREGEEMQRFEEQSSLVSQNLVANLSTRLDKIVKQEIKSTVVPHMTKYTDTLMQQLQGQILQSLNSTDSALKENLTKHLQSKVFSDNLATATAGRLQHGLQSACREVFENSVTPSLNECCKALFSQMNDVFVKGSREYVEKSERYLQAANTGMDITTKRFNEQISKFMLDAESVLMKVSARSQDNLVEVASGHEKLIENVRKAVHEEIHKSMVVQSTSGAFAAIRSSQSTPAPPGEPLANPQHILQLAKAGRISEAFQQALSAVDIKLVILLCETVTVDQVFEPVPCPLGQNVLLSLIHQLSGDLKEKTSVKIKYIEDAIASLDSNSPVTKEHMGMVLSNLKLRVGAFMKANPTHKTLRNCRRILLTIDSFLK